MNETKSMKKTDFLICTAFTALLSYFLYFKLIFRSCGGMTYGNSVMLFGVLAATSFGIFGIMQHIEDARDSLEIFFMVFSPISIYTFIAYRTEYALYFKGIALVTLVIAAKIYHWGFIGEKAPEDRKNAALFSKLIMFVLITLCVFVFLMTIANVCIGVNNIIDIAYGLNSDNVVRQSQYLIPV